MVSKKKLDWGFNGFQVPFIPKAPRSVRRRRSCNKLNDGEICAFELLAAVAGKLLEESESSASSNAAEGKYELSDCRDGSKRELVEEDKALKSECLDQGSCVENNFSLEHSSLLENLEEDPSDIKITTETQKHLDGDTKKTEDLTLTNTCNVKGPVEEHVNNNALVNSESSVQLSLYRGSVPSVKKRNSVKLGSRDDDENSYGCYRHSTKLRTFRAPTSRIGYRRIRKMLSSRHWKASPKLKDYGCSYTNGGMESFYLNKKRIHARKRWQHEVPSKRRKLSGRSYSVAYYQEASSESISKLSEKGIKREINTFTGTTESVTVKNHHNKDPNVKFSIKSFKVPELYVEVPETATVGSLKIRVMEAVTAILRSGLRVGVVLEGKKVRDDHRTLEQAGISQHGNLDSLGFTLEPRFTRVSPASSTLVADQELTRHQPSPTLESGIPVSSESMETELNKHDENNNPVNPSTDHAVVPEDSRALVIVPAVNALAMVPLTQKSKRSELSQRRIRRPFSVAEVEALVEAVESLGTGRWRDVKMRAFDNTDHRTYVDLKDKWKTLVHTASIGPQQRRGEPVPQVLLDRVLAAHAYWTQQQGKHAEPLKVLEPNALKVDA
uniref:Putative telomeric protein n=1 Tax=Cestrum parqui TaxID=142762 RepID=F8QZH2_9SOLA|nr:putative telomeric protein [Cestrum parqui]